RAFENGLAPVFINEKWGYVNTSGEMTIPATYNDAEVFSKDGLAPVKIGKDWGFINAKGELVIPAQYQITVGGGFGIFQSADSKGFIDGLARVKKEKVWGYIKKDGSLLANKWFENIEMFSN
ncbi:MAG TPA: WG repeat-containing protein, partial [Flavobacteriaceae bacterium]|nr:WG repeat-containing protein [Flavobacteriaceae bacterium]